MPGLYAAFENKEQLFQKALDRHVTGPGEWLELRIVPDIGGGSPGRRSRSSASGSRPLPGGVVESVCIRPYQFMVQIGRVRCPAHLASNRWGGLTVHRG